MSITCESSALTLRWRVRRCTDRQGLAVHLERLLHVGPEQDLATGKSVALQVGSAAHGFSMVTVPSEVLRSDDSGATWSSNKPQTHAVWCWLSWQ